MRPSCWHPGGVSLDLRMNPEIWMALTSTPAQHKSYFSFGKTRWNVQKITWERATTRSRTLLPVLSLSVLLPWIHSSAVVTMRHKENELLGRRPSRQSNTCAAVVFPVPDSSASVSSTVFLCGLCFEFNFPHMIELWLLGRIRFFSFTETLE